MLRRGSCLLVSACAVFLASGTDSARSRAAAAFSVTVQGTQHTLVTRTRTTTDELGCSVTRREVDRQTLTFDTRRPGRLVLGGGRTRVVIVVSAGGSKTRETTVAGPAPECSIAPQTSETECGPAKLDGSAVVRVLSPRSVSLSGALARKRDRSRCAPTAAPAYPFLVRTHGAFRATHLADPSIERVRLRGNTVLTDRLVSGARRVTTVRWTVVFQRLT